MVILCVISVLPIQFITASTAIEPSVVVATSRDATKRRSATPAARYAPPLTDQTAQTPAPIQRGRAGQLWIAPTGAGIASGDEGGRTRDAIPVKL